MKPSISYIIRYSARAKSVRLRVSMQNGVEVIVPQGYDTIHIPAFVQEQAEWIYSAQQRLQEKMQRHKQKLHAFHDATAGYPCTEPSLPEETIVPQRRTLILPTELIIRTLDEVWLVIYQPSKHESITLTMSTVDKQLVLSGAVHKKRLCAQALATWVKRYAAHWLPRMAREISVEIGLPCADIRVRLQKTRWGSCSSHRNINLNASLLFLPEELTRYVIIHELCHTKVMNHSKEFWQLVGEKEPDYKRLDKALNPATQLVPTWLMM